MRRFAKVDANQKEIVESLRSLGVTVISLATVGKNCPDIVAGHAGKNYLFEIKNPKRYYQSSDKRAVEGQDRFAELWRGQLSKVETLEQILEIMGIEITST